MRTYDLKEINLKVDKVDVGVFDDFSSITISWSSDSLGIGTYSFHKERGSDEWIADSEHMDDKTDREFGETLLKIWLSQCTMNN